MAVAQRMSEQEYQSFVLSGPNERWELHDGQLVEKPGGTFEHGDIAFEVGHLLGNQLDYRQFRLAINDWRVRRHGLARGLPRRDDRPRSPVRSVAELAIAARRHA